MYYKFIKECRIKGCYTEPIYDEAPDVASFSTDIEKMYHEGDVISGMPDKNDFALCDTHF